jgi:hypothetical protein
MNQVSVTGGKKFERDIVEQTVAFCIRKMMPRLRTLDIEIKVKKLKDAMGYCMMGDTNRDFELEIKSGMGMYDLISTVCHEMVHVKQYARKEIWLDRDYNQRWKRSRVSSNTEYMDLPWEKEAFRQERALAVECFESMCN